MKIKFTIIVLLLLQLSLFAQKEYVNDSLNTSLSYRKFNGFLCILTDITWNEHMQFTSAGMGGALLFADKYYIGAYGVGLMSTLKKSNILIDNVKGDFQLNYAHGGLWLGMFDAPCKGIENSFSLKFGWGAMFMYNPNYIIDYNKARTEFFVITPNFETSVLITNWLKIHIGVGVRFLAGISSQFKNSNGNTANIYNLSDFEGFVTSFSLSFGSFYNKSALK